MVGGRGGYPAGGHGARRVEKPTVDAPGLHPPAYAATTRVFGKRDAAGYATRFRACARHARATPFVVIAEAHGRQDIARLRLRPQRCRTAIEPYVIVGRPTIRFLNRYPAIGSLCGN